MRTVRFTRSFRVWAGGEIAGFTPDMADQLVRDGVAVEVDPAEIEASAPAAPEPVAPVAVRFKRPHGIWNGGEVAGFPPAEAAGLVEIGVAGLLADEAADPEPDAGLFAAEPTTQARRSRK